MSTYDDSSLFLYPSGYKASVLFAQKPMDANGQLAFTRSNDTATRVDENGLIEKVRTNLAINSAWAGVGTGVPPTSWSTFDPNFSAGPSAGQIRFNTTANRGYIFQSFTVAAGDYTQSVFVDSVTTTESVGSILTVAGVTATNSVFYEDGVVISAGENIKAGKRYARKLTLSAGTASVRIGSGVGSSTTADWVGSRPQFEVGDIATDYIATTTTAVSVGPVANIPRIDYTGGGCGKLLLEPQRTNLVTFSEQMDNAVWTKSGCTATANNTISPSGYQDADEINMAAPNASLLRQIITVTASTAYTFSFYVKRGTATNLRYNVRDITNSTDITAKVDYTSQTSTTQWNRISVTFTTPVGCTSVGVFPNRDSSSAGTFYVWGCQLEAGSYASSYVSTLAASVTRGADACSKTGISSLIGQTEGTIFWDINDITGTPTSTGNPDFGIRNTAFTNWIGITTNGFASPFRIVVRPTSGTIIDYTANITRAKAAVAYSSAGVILYVNGAQVATSAVNPNFSFDIIQMLGGIISYKTNQALLFKTRLPNSELAALTTL